MPRRGPPAAAGSEPLSTPADASDGLLGPAAIRSLAQQLDLRPTKQLGQNFLHDANTIRRIVRTAELRAHDVVCEIGPGLGSLTLGLLPATERVVAVEIDPRLAEQLPRTVAERTPALADRLTVVTADAMRITELPGPAPTALVANLPYNISVPVLLHLLERFPSIRTALVLVQLEVAERLAAAPGSDAYGVPSVKAAWYADVRRAGAVGRPVFWPVPNVDSSLLRLVRRPAPASTAGRAAVFAVVDAAFAQRRKTLRSALAGWAGSPAAAEAVLRRAGVEPSLRGEVLTVADFVAIADAAVAIGAAGAAVRPPHQADTGL